MGRRKDKSKDSRKIYKITNIENSKIYIGKTIKPLELRFTEHIHEAQRWLRCLNAKKDFGYSSRLYPAMNAHGYDKFIIELLEDLDVENCSESLEAREQYWIAYYNATDDSIGYNISPGGLGGPLFAGHKHSKEACEKLRAHSKKNIKLDPESLLQRKLPCTRKLQNLITGEVDYITHLPKGYNFSRYLKDNDWPDFFNGLTIYKIEDLFYVSLGQRREELAPFDADTRKELDETAHKVVQLLMKRRTSRYSDAIAKWTDEKRQDVGKRTAAKVHAINNIKRKNFCEALLAEHSATIDDYITTYLKYAKNCPHKHIELTFGITLSQSQAILRYIKTVLNIDLPLGGSSHAEVKD